MRQLGIWVAATLLTCTLAFLMQAGATTDVSRQANPQLAEEPPVSPAGERLAPVTAAHPQTVFGATRDPAANFKQLDEKLQAFRRIDYGQPPMGDRRAEDAYLRELLDTKATALDEVLTAYAEFIEVQDPNWSVNGMIRMAEARSEMSLWLRDSPVPSYLEHAQAVVYQDALGHRAAAQADKARDLLDDVLERVTVADPRGPHVEKILSSLPE